MKRLAAMRQLRLNQRQVRDTMELLDQRDMLEKREDQGVADTLNETRQILMTGDTDRSRYISAERYRQILQGRLYSPAQGRDRFHITTLKDLAEAKRYFRNSGHDPKLLDANWENAFEDESMSSTFAQSEPNSPSIFSVENTSAVGVSAEPDMEVTLPAQRYFPPLLPSVRQAEVGQKRTLAERIQEIESMKGFLRVPAITISRSQIPLEDPTRKTRNQLQGNSPDLMETFANAASTIHSSNLLQIPSRTPELHPPQPLQSLRLTLQDQGEISSTCLEPVHSSTRESSPRIIMRTKETLQLSTIRKCSAIRGLSEPPSPKRVRFKDGENPLIDQPGAAAPNRGEINKVACPQGVQPSEPMSNWMPELPKFDNPALPTSSKPARLNAAFRASAISSNAKAMMPRSANSTRPPPVALTTADMTPNFNAEKSQDPVTVAATQLETPVFESIPKATKAESAKSSTNPSIPTATMFSQDSIATTMAPVPNATLSTTVGQTVKKVGEALGTSTNATGTSRPGDLLSIPGTTSNSITAGEILNTFLYITAQKKTDASGIYYHHVRNQPCQLLHPHLRQGQPQLRNQIPHRQRLLLYKGSQDEHLRKGKRKGSERIELVLNLRWSETLSTYLL